jgi:EAL domain-containing protein (putative c-di-GMP-specific phosphodiesterase class I)/GAF domain-containing protein
MLDQEHLRLRALRDLKLLETAPSESFDRITRMASKIFQAPISAVSLTDEDRQWFKSRVGCGTEIPRDKAPCAEVTRTSQLLVVPDLAADERFQGSILVEGGVRFYAGAPLVTRDGYTLGAMCVLDTEPRTISEEEADSLRDLSAMVMAQIELQHALGRVDPATGLANRYQFSDDLEDMARDLGRKSAIGIMIDIHDLHRLAQAMRVLGATYLDDALKAAVPVIRSGLGDSAILYQVGATQFASVIVPGDGADNPDAVSDVLSDLTNALLAENIGGGEKATVGVVTFELGAKSAEQVLRAAHNAALDARDRDQVIGTYSPASDDDHQRRYAIISGLREALTAGDQFRLVYQPRVDLKSGYCEGVEALLRWSHPSLGDVSPGEFIPLAETSGLMKALTVWVVDAATAQAARWKAAGVNLRISINVSAANLEEDTFSARIADALSLYNVSPNSLEIEFTESALADNQTKVLRNLAKIREMGIACAIDDFGTGYSSFSYLQEIPAEVIKIDQSFIRTLVPGSRDSALVKSMIDMTHDLGFTVVAEGVETAEILDLLKSFGCDEAQGYFICRPAPPDTVTAWLKDGGFPLRPRTVVAETADQVSV